MTLAFNSNKLKKIYENGFCVFFKPILKIKLPKP